MACAAASPTVRLIAINNLPQPSPTSASCIQLFLLRRTISAPHQRPRSPQLRCSGLIVFLPTFLLPCFRGTTGLCMAIFSHLIRLPRTLPSLWRYLPNDGPRRFLRLVPLSRDRGPFISHLASSKPSPPSKKGVSWKAP